MVSVCFLFCANLISFSFDQSAEVPGPTNFFSSSRVNIDFLNQVLDFFSKVAFIELPKILVRLTENSLKN